MTHAEKRRQGPRSGQQRRFANLSPHCLLHDRRMCGNRQLQHRRALAFAKAREQHHLSVRKFQRIVMGCHVVHVDLPEAREPLPDLLVWQNTDAERRLALDILIERNFGTRQQADRNIRLADRRETARDELENLVTTRLSSTLAGRLATWCRL